jgi:hypothetical protein
MNKLAHNRRAYGYTPLQDVEVIQAEPEESRQGNNINCIENENSCSRNIAREGNCNQVDVSSELEKRLQYTEMEFRALMSGSS